VSDESEPIGNPDELDADPYEEERINNEYRLSEVEQPDLETVDEELRDDSVAEDLLEAGLSIELVDDLSDLMAVAGETSVPSALEDLVAGPAVDADVLDQVAVDAETAERLLRVVYKKLNAYQTEYGELPEQLILGLPQFKAIEAYTWDSEEQPAEERLPVDEILVVPGPQVHCVRDPYEMIAASLQEDEDTDVG